jgi:transcriptional regulator with XRE-family HTH domain
MTTKQPIPNSLRSYRKQAGLRQVDVAARLGFTSTDRISHWEKGQAFPSVTNLFKLSAIYKAPAQELYGEFFKSVDEKISHQEISPADHRQDSDISSQAGFSL